jgi:Tol biopolymer transport system component
LHAIITAVNPSRRPATGSRSVLTALALLAAAAGLWFLNHPGGIKPTRASAGHATSCNITQITDTTTGGNYSPAMSGDGGHIAFEAPELEIAVHDIEQGTTTSLATFGPAPGAAGFPTIDAAGTRVMFASSADVLPPGNVDESSEIYVIDVSGPDVQQLTDGSNPANSSADITPSISGDGTRVAFNYDGDLTGDNEDGSFEVFLYDFGEESYAQLTSGLSFFPVISDDGTIVAFHSTADPTGENADHSNEIFVLDVASKVITQMTDSPGGSSSLFPSLNRDGSRIAFHSTADLTGENADENAEIFLLDVASSTLTQITKTSGGLANTAASLDGVGDRVAFTSSRDITGDNPDGNRELFLTDLGAGTTTQITDTTAGSSIFTNSSPSISDSGSRVAFTSSGDVTGGNPDGNSEIFLAECPSAGVWGDHDCSGSANAVDSLLTLRYDAGLDANTGSCPELGEIVDVVDASPHIWGDVDCSGDVTVVDSLKVLRFAAALTPAATDGCPKIGSDIAVFQ